MGREVELKLAVRPSAIDEIFRLPWLSETSNDAPKCEKLVTVYFDTSKFRLREHGLVIHIRHIGESRLQTIKSDKKVRAASLAVTNGKKKSKLIRRI